MMVSAAQSLGGVPVPLYQDAVAAEMLFVLQDAGIHITIVEDQEQVNKMLEVIDQCPELRARHLRRSARHAPLLAALPAWS